MAENRHPGGEPDSAYQIRTAFSSMTVGTPQQQQPLPKLDLASLKKPRSKNNKNKIDSSPFKKRTSAVIAEPKPMSGDRMFNVAGSTGSGAQGYSNHELAGQTLTVNVDTTRTQLISPPLEEMLRRNQQRFPPLFTPSLLADDDVGRRMGAIAQPTPVTNKNTKRKRQLATPKVSKTALPATAEEGDLEGNLGDVASTSTISGTGTGVGGWAEATPNPRLRKQVRRQAQFEHEGDDDLDGDDQDVEMESPTRPSYTSGARDAHTSP
ncbi:hypothetical protein D9611_007955 [Ephemerocybe angulata]|uniref:Uncharacterized protein n=1 Tax=Ephemerocybe angulata TaxID=980116 RepID=A0A8H5CED5_9AGAR|nr:hypothetical protein D9611_007955 [Tulosesus angulatus]